MKLSDIIGSVALILLIGGSGWYIYEQRPCAPLTYYISSVDPRFGVSTTTVAELAEEGAFLWNTASGKQLLTRSTEPVRGAIPISLIYDERQQIVEESQAISSAQSQDARLRAEFDAATARYQAHQAAYERDKAAFEKAAAQYDAQVRKTNQAGGATPAEFAALSAQRQSLQQQQANLNAQVDELNAENAALRGQMEAYNLRVQQTNEEVATFNAEAEEDFNAGEYRSDVSGARIQIYEYANKTQLMRVLSHELGHALGLEHVATTDSIMHPYNTSSKTVLTAEDTAELKRACTLTPKNFL